MITVNMLLCISNKPMSIYLFIYDRWTDLTLIVCSSKCISQLASKTFTNQNHLNVQSLSNSLILFTYLSELLITSQFNVHAWLFFGFMHQSNGISKYKDFQILQLL